MTANPESSFGALAAASLRRIVEKPVIALVLAALFAPLALFPFTRAATGEDDAEAEGRDYAQLPGFPASFAALASFPRRFERFFNDQFPLRLPLVRLASRVRFRVFAVPPTLKILVGRDGWFYEGVGKERVQGTQVRTRNHFADHVGELRYTEKELAQWERVLEERRVVLAEQGSHYVFAIAPSKRMVYPEYMPAALQPLKRETRMEQLGRYLPKRARVPIVDLTGALLADKKLADRPLLFLKTDTHWNYYGAYVAYRALVEETNRAFSGLLGPPLALEQFRIEYQNDWAHPRVTAQMGQRIPEPHVSLVAREGNPLGELQFSAGPPFRQVFGKEQPGPTLSLSREGVGGILDWPKHRFEGVEYRHIKGVPTAPVPRILVLGDSMIEKAFYLFAAHGRDLYNYREILGFPHEFMTKFAPNVVIHTIVQGFILTEPPENPDSLVQAYLRIKHAESQRALLDTGSDGLKEHGKRASLAIPPLDVAAKSSVVVAVEGSGQVRLWFEPPKGKRRADRRPTEPGRQYLELDDSVVRRGGKLVFDARRSSLDRLKVSIRAIDR